MMLDSREIDALGPATVADLNSFESWPLEAQCIAARVMRERFENTGGSYDCEGCYQRGFADGREEAGDEIRSALVNNEQLRKQLGQAES